MQRTGWRVAAIGLVTALTLAACGNGAEEPSAVDESEEAPAEEPDTDTDEEDADEPPEVEEEEELEPASITVAFSIATPDANTAFLWVPEAAGFYEEENLDVEIVNLGGSIEAMRAVSTGQADYMIGTLEGVAQFNLSGDPLQAIYQYAYAPIFSMGIPTDSDLEGPGDLAGGSVGIVAAGSAAIPPLQFLLEANGVSAGDVDIVPIGFGPQAVEAIESGQVDAVMYWDTAYVDFANAGLEFDFYSDPELDAGYASMGLVYDRTRADELGDITPRFLRAITKGLVFSEADHEAAIRAMGEVEPGVLDDIDLSVNKWATRLAIHELPPEADGQYGWSNEENWERLHAVLLAGGVIEEAIPFSDAWDGSYLEAANDFDHDRVAQDAVDY